MGTPQDVYYIIIHHRLVAELELVVDGWPDLVPALVQTATAATSNKKEQSHEKAKFSYTYNF